MKITTQRLEIHPMRQEEWRDILELFRDFSASPAVIYDFPLPTSEEKAKEQVRSAICVSLGSRNGISAICFTASGTARAMPRKQRGR